MYTTSWLPASAEQTVNQVPRGSHVAGARPEQLMGRGYWALSAVGRGVGSCHLRTVLGLLWDWWPEPVATPLGGWVRVSFPGKFFSSPLS